MQNYLTLKPTGLGQTACRDATGHIAQQLVLSGLTFESFALPIAFAMTSAFNELMKASRFTCTARTEATQCRTLKHAELEPAGANGFKRKYADSFRDKDRAATDEMIRQ